MNRKVQSSKRIHRILAEVWGEEIERTEKIMTVKGKT